MVLLERFDDEEIQRKPYWSPPVRIAAKQATGGLSGLIIYDILAAASFEDKGMLAVIGGHRAKSVRRQEFLFIEHDRKDAAQPGFIDDGKQLPVSLAAFGPVRNIRGQIGAMLV